MLLPPKQRVLISQLPPYLKGLDLRTSSEKSVRLELVDPSEPQGPVVERKLGIFNEENRDGDYKGLGIVYSVSDVPQNIAEAKNNSTMLRPSELLYIIGTLTFPFQLRLLNLQQSFQRVRLDYSTSGIDPCPPIPVGCGTYNEKLASAAVLAWSKWAAATYPSSAEAWSSIAKPHVSGDGEVPWYRWPGVWSMSFEPDQAWTGSGTGGSTLGTSAAEEPWQLAFKFLDSDRNGEISEAEFAVAFNMTRQPGVVIATTKPEGQSKTQNLLLQQTAIVLAYVVAIVLCLAFGSAMRTSRVGAPEAAEPEAEMHKPAVALLAKSRELRTPVDPCSEAPGLFSTLLAPWVAPQLAAPYRYGPLPMASHFSSEVHRPSVEERSASFASQQMSFQPAWLGTGAPAWGPSGDAANCSFHLPSPAASRPRAFEDSYWAGRHGLPGSPHGWAAEAQMQAELLSRLSKAARLPVPVPLEVNVAVEVVNPGEQ